MPNLQLNSSSYTYEGTRAFVAPLCKAYEKGTVSLDKTSEICSKILKEKHGPQLRFIDEAIEGKRLLQLRELCILGVEAKTSYYENTALGKVAKFIQHKLSFLFGFLGYKTPIQAATQVRDQINMLLSKEIFADAIQESKASDTEALAFIARYFSKMEGETVYFPIGENTLNPDQIFIAKTNGDVYVLTRNDKKKFVDQGSGRAVYKGECYSTNKPPRDIAIVTSLPKNGLFETDSAEVVKVTQKMKHEQQQLESFKASDGIIKIQDQFSTTIDGTEIGFSIMDYYKDGNLETFLKSIDKKDLNNEQKQNIKLTLMRSLAAIMKEIHEKKKIHRDIKEKNILIDIDPATQKIKPILIDFESCIDITDKERKKEISSTSKYWAPEYLAAFQKGLDNAAILKLESSPAEKYVNFKITSVTSTAMDIWSLGLIFYRIWYGKDLAETSVLDKK